MGPKPKRNANKRNPAQRVLNATKRFAAFLYRKIHRNYPLSRSLRTPQSLRHSDGTLINSVARDSNTLEGWTAGQLRSCGLATGSTMAFQPSDLGSSSEGHPSCDSDLPIQRSEISAVDNIELPIQSPESPIASSKLPWPTSDTCLAANYVEVSTTINSGYARNLKLALTPDTFAELNALFKHEYGVNRTAQEIADMTQNMEELSAMIRDTDLQIYHSADAEERRKLWASRQEGCELLEECFQLKKAQGERLARRLEKSRAGIKWKSLDGLMNELKMGVLRDLRVYMYNNDGLADVKDPSHGSSEATDMQNSATNNEHSRAQHRSDLGAISSTSSEAEITAAQDEVYAAYAAMRSAQAAHDRFQISYSPTSSALRYAIQDGYCISRTEFDIHLALDRANMTSKLIRAEAGLLKARAEARELRVPLFMEEQESGFLTHEMDGVFEGVDPGPSRSTYIKAVEKWRQGIVESEASQIMSCESVECDHWDMKPAEVSDSISVVAMSQDRKRIDRSHSRCDSDRDLWLLGHEIDAHQCRWGRLPSV